MESAKRSWPRPTSSSRSADSSSPTSVVPRAPDAPRPRSFADAKRLLLAIEVLSPSTARRDRGVKRRIYMDEQVDEYWIVDADAWVHRAVAAWRRPSRDRDGDARVAAGGGGGGAGDRGAAGVRGGAEIALRAAA
ncbi:MAG: Uma2 family endonuclease [Gemmatimonadetes bacterium]|nr:Uma2 family endonuclease [Gemmatimonadota bacterium]